MELNFEELLNQMGIAYEGCCTSYTDVQQILYVLFFIFFKLSVRYLFNSYFL